MIGRHARRNTAQPELRTADTRLQQVLGPRKRYALDGPYGLAASEDTSWAAPGVRRARQPRGVGADR